MLERPVWAIVLRVALVFFLVYGLHLSTNPARLSKEWILVNTALEDGQPGAAASSLRRIAAAQPWRADLLYLSGQYALQAGDWALGLESLTRMPPDHLTAADRINMGDAYLELGNTEQAIRAWGQSLAITENTQAYTRLYTLHRQQQNYPAVLADLWALQRLLPQDAELAYQLAVHLAASAPQTAFDFIERASIADDPTLQKLHRLQSKLLEALKHTSSAEQMLGAGQGLAELGEWELAVQAFRTALQFEPDYAEAWAFLGEARQHLEPAETETALEELRQALRLNPTSVAANSMLALYWQRQGDYPRAADLYRSTAKLEPKNPAWFAALGGLASVQGDLSAAEGYYRYATSLAEQEAVYWRLLAGFYITNQIQIETGALSAATKAVGLDPDDPANLDMLAQVNLQLDRMDAALRLLNNALNKDPRYAPAHMHLGMVFLLQGQGELAHYHLELAVQLARDQATASQAQRLIEYYFP